MRRVSVVFAFILAATVSPVAGGVAHASTPTQAGSASTSPSVHADFNNDGYADLAIGVDGEDVGSVADAGAVNVLYGSASGVTGTGSQLFTQVGSAAERGDYFGGSLAAGDFNNDGYADLAVGAPGEDAGSVVDAGAVSVLYGSSAGLSTAGGQLFTQVGSAAERGDFFGFALTTGDFNNDGYADLVAGAPFEDANAVEDAGAVSVLYGSATRLSTSGGQLFTQVGSPVDYFEYFGFSVAADDFNNDGYSDLAAGAPGQIVGSAFDAGGVSVVYSSGGRLSTTGGRMFTQVGSAAETGDAFGLALAAGDFNNDGYADLAAGAPYEDAGSIVDAGAVSVLYSTNGPISTTGGQLFTQVGSPAEHDDAFGLTLAAGDFNNDGYADLAASAPGEDASSIVDAGAVSLLYGSATRLSTSGGQLFTQVGSPAERYDSFGYGLATGDFNNDGYADLASSAPGEDAGSIVDAGAVSTLPGSAARVTTTGARLFTQDSPGVGSFAEPGDYFGDSLASGGPQPGGAAAAGTSPSGGSSPATGLTTQRSAAR